MKFNSDFKFDLKVGQVGEKYLASILENKKIEIKADLQATQTGNLFIEYSDRGKPSGIATTHASWWGFVITNENIFLIKVETLKNLCRKYLNSKRDIRGGDFDQAKGILLPLRELVKG